MDRLWPRHAPVACIHPGWAALGDRRSVMESWGEILSNPEAPRIECHDEEVALLGDVAIVLCEEVLPSATLAATNLFVKEDGGWRLIHHQASPVFAAGRTRQRRRSEEHTSELQSLMRISYAVFC